MFAFNITEHKFYVYSEKGLLLNRIDYSEKVKQYGDEASASSNGLNFALFKNRTDQVTILRFNELDCTILKTLNIEGSIKELLKSNMDQSLDALRDSDHWLWTTRKSNIDCKI